MRLDVQALESRDQAALAQLMEVCRGCARIGASKAGAHAFADDIAQDLAMFVLEKFLPRYDPERDVEPYLIESARRMGLAYLRRHSKEYLVGAREEGVDPVALLVDEEIRGEERLVEDEVDRQAEQAKGILIERLRAKRGARPRRAAKKPAAAPKRRERSRPAPNLPPPTEAESRAERARLARVARPSVQELVKIRRRVGLTQEEMARALSLKDNSIRSIEYGVVAGEPEKLLRKARALERKHKRIDADLPAPKLIRKWCKMLRLNEGDTVELSRLIGVHRSTLYRWSVSETQPHPHRVRRLNAVVEALAEHV